MEPVTPPPDATRAWLVRVWTISWPIILANSTVPLVGAVDTAVVGHLPDPAYIGAVALGAVVFNFLFWGFGFLRMGTTGFVAQAHGGGHRDEVAAAAGRGLLLAGAFGLALIALKGPVGALAFGALQGGPRVESLAGEYYAVRIWSAPAALANYVVLGLLIGLQRTRSALAIQLVLNGVNLGLDLLFVVVLGWGVPGVAGASLVAEYTALGLGLLVAVRHLRRLGAAWPGRALVDGRRMRALLRVNLDIFLRTLGIIFAFFHFTSEGARLGDVILAANAVLIHFQHFLAFGLDGFAHAAEGLAGSAYGARDRAVFRAAVLASGTWALAVAAAYAAVFALAGDVLAGWITDIEPVRAAVREYLPWLVISPLVSVWSFHLDGVFVGATRTVDMRNAMLVSVGAYLVAVWTLPPLWGNHGLWAAITVFMVFRGLTLGIRYPRILASLEDAPATPRGAGSP